VLSMTTAAERCAACNCARGAVQLTTKKAGTENRRRRWERGRARARRRPCTSGRISGAPTGCTLTLDGGSVQDGTCWAESLNRLYRLASYGPCDLPDARPPRCSSTTSAQTRCRRAPRSPCASFPSLPPLHRDALSASSSGFPSQPQADWRWLPRFLRRARSSGTYLFDQPYCRSLALFGRSSGQRRSSFCNHSATPETAVKMGVRRPEFCCRPRARAHDFAQVAAAMQSCPTR